MKIDIEQLKESFPFISHLESDNGTDYYGIVINCDRNCISFINIEKLQTQNEFVRLMKLSQNWWWYSNRTIPLNLFYQSDMEYYMDFLTQLPYKTTQIKTGHIASLKKILDSTKTSRKNRIVKSHQ